MKHQLLVKPKNRFTTAAIIVATLVAGGFLTYYLTEEQVDRSTLDPAYETQVLPQAVAAIGYLEPQGEVIKVSASAFFEGATVEQLLVKRGDLVTKGQTIAILDDYSRFCACSRASTKAGNSQSSSFSTSASWSQTR